MAVRKRFEEATVSVALRFGGILALSGTRLGCSGVWVPPYGTNGTKLTVQEEGREDRSRTFARILQSTRLKPLKPGRIHTYRYLLNPSTCVVHLVDAHPKHFTGSPKRIWRSSRKGVSTESASKINWKHKSLKRTVRPVALKDLDSTRSQMHRSERPPTHASRRAAALILIR
jgi:hypothetical protein